MSEDTPAHGLTLPEAGASGWHRPLNANFEAIDARLLIQAPTVADLKDRVPEPTDDMWAFVETEREWWTGTTNNDWVQVGHLKETQTDVYVGTDEPDDWEEGDVWIVP